MSDGITVDTSSFRAFARDCERAALEVDRALAVAIQTTAQAIRKDVQARWSFSSRLPSHVHAVGAGTAATVFVSPSLPPHAGEAAAFEHHGREGDFVHPVFGDPKVRVRQHAHPAVGPAADAAFPLVVRGGETAIDSALAMLHSHG